MFEKDICILSKDKDKMGTHIKIYMPIDKRNFKISLKRLII